MDQVVEEVLGSLRVLEHAALIIFGSLDLERQIVGNQEFVPSWMDTTPKMSGGAYLGRLGHTPVFRQFQDTSDKVLIASLSNLGDLVHHIPPKHNYQGLRISIGCYDQEEAATMVSQHPEVLPETLKDEDGNPKEQNDAIRWLLLQVKVFVGVKLEWQGLGAAPGFVIPVTQADKG